MRLTERKTVAKVPLTERYLGAQIGSIDALLAQLCMRHQLTLLTTAQDFIPAARHCRLRIWRA
ncbi:hypothetical protein LBMAG47_10640 [Planctomycetia bacterium]|nr:hypothetical protein LBMAG47_10640 [Planctomycetia bacterium]